MPKSDHQKLKILYLRKILLEETDENHILTIAQIIDELGRYGIRAERKSIYDDMNALRDLGLDIVYRRGEPSGYFIASRAFELPELKLLADAVASSKFITEKKSARLIKKIGGLASGPQAKGLERQVCVRGRVKTRNEQIYYNVDTIHQAIAQGVPVAFRYFEYCIDWSQPSGWKKRFRHDGGKYLALPYALTWDNENYYMIAYYEKYGSLSHFRVDKMDRIELLSKEELKKPEGITFNAAEYSREVFGMFSGQREQITLRFDNSLIGVVLDRFGKNAEISMADENSFRLRAEAVTGPTFFAWLFGFGAKACIEEPASLAGEMRKMAQDCFRQNSIK